MESNRKRVRRRDGVASTPTSETSTVKVYRTYTSAGVLMDEDEGKEDLEVRKFEVEPAYVSYSVGRTVNLGNYESARVDVRVSIPCYKEEIDPALIYAETKAADYLDTVMDDYIQELK